MEHEFILLASQKLIQLMGIPIWPERWLENYLQHGYRKLLTLQYLCLSRSLHLQFNNTLIIKMDKCKSCINSAALKCLQTCNFQVLPSAKELEGKRKEDIASMGIGQHMLNFYWINYEGSYLIREVKGYLQFHTIILQETLLLFFIILWSILIISLNYAFCPHLDSLGPRSLKHLLSLIWKCLLLMLKVELLVMLLW